MVNEYIESETLELKSKYTEGIVKEIVSFLNGKEVIMDMVVF